jgi:hypothetical protein
MRTALLGALVLYLAMAGCRRASLVTINTSVNLAQPRRLAVLPFTDAKGESGSNTFILWATESNNGEAVAGYLAEALVTCECYRVVERSQLKAILEEHDLTGSNLIEKKGYKEAGRLLGADALVIGNVNRYTQTSGLWFFAEASFSARCIDIRTGEILWSASPSVQSFGSLAKFTKAKCREIAASVRRAGSGEAKP